MTTFRDAQIEAAQEFHAHEMAVDGDGYERRWMRFLREIERLTGIANLDGNRTEEHIAAGTADAAALDECMEWFDAGKTPQAAAQIINDRPGVQAQRDWNH